MADDIPKGTVTARTVKVDLTITEKREGEYSEKNVASTTIQVRLPADAASIGRAVAEHITGLDKTVRHFHGDEFIVESTPAEESVVVASDGG